MERRARRWLAATHEPAEPDRCSFDADLAAVHRDYAPRGLRVVAVSVDAGSEALVRRFVQRESLTFPVVHDQAGTIQKQYRVVGVPTSYLIGADGRVLWQQVGGIHGNLPTVRVEVEKAMRVERATSSHE